MSLRRMCKLSLHRTVERIWSCFGMKIRSYQKSREVFCIKHTFHLPLFVQIVCQPLQLFRNLPKSIHFCVMKKHSVTKLYGSSEVGRFKGWSLSPVSAGSKHVSLCKQSRCTDFAAHSSGWKYQTDMKKSKSKNNCYYIKRNF